MKKPKDVSLLANRLANAATTPLVEPIAPASPKRRSPSQNIKNVFLRVPSDLYQKFDEEAVRRTKATGRGVTVQQVILDKLAGTE